MRNHHATSLGRREFLHGLALAGTATLARGHSTLAAAEPPPETSRIRLTQSIAICTAPQLVAAELLNGEGFTDVQHSPPTRPVR